MTCPCIAAHLEEGSTEMDSLVSVPPTSGIAGPIEFEVLLV